MKLLGELWTFLWRRKRYWLLPWIVVLLMLAALLALGGGTSAPFIYNPF